MLAMLTANWIFSSFHMIKASDANCDTAAVMLAAPQLTRGGTRGTVLLLMSELSLLGDFLTSGLIVLSQAWN